MESNYIVQKTDNSICPICESKVSLLIEKDARPSPSFYICFKCGYTAEIGVGPCKKNLPPIKNLTDEEIEQKLVEEIYEIMTKQMFYDFYMSEAEKSFTAHIRCDDNCPTKEQMLKELKTLFLPVIRKVKELICQ